MKKNILKIITLLLALGLVGGVFSACGTDASEEESSMQEVAQSAEANSDKTTTEGSLQSAIQELNSEDKLIGIVEDPLYEECVEELVPNAQVSVFEGYADLVQALVQGKVDAILDDKSTLGFLKSETGEIEIVGDTGEYLEYGFIFAKTDEGTQLCAEFNTFLAQIKSDGTLDELIDKWFTSSTQEKEIIDYESLPATNGTLRFGTDPVITPFTYLLRTNYVGLDVELAVLFCQEYGYALEIGSIEQMALPASVESDKIDFAGAGLTITDERKESFNFSDVYFSDSACFAERTASSGTEDESFVSAVGTRISNTFLRSARWALFLEGVLVTILIAFSSIVLGCAIGFGVYMIYRRGNKVAAFIVKWSIVLIQGMPPVLLLMIFFYLIFANVMISGIIVSIIVFTLVFASNVIAMLAKGVNELDDGQYEAALALGYSDLQSFFKIILPQVQYNMLPEFKQRAISLLKGTAIVGYIAVQDVTKMGDIIRSRTFDAFFPLIGTAIIYYLLSALLNLVIDCLSKKLNPMRRTKEEIMKGVDDE